MNCPYCNIEVPVGREICPNTSCYKPIKPIPVPPGGKIRFGEYDWYVLEKKENKALLLTEKVVGAKEYHRKPCAFTWETCDMRQYLNGTFYDSFSETDRARIIETVNVNDNNPWYGTNGGNPTNDKVFLLSIKEVFRYFGDSGQYENRPRMYENCDWCKDEFLPWTSDDYNLNRRAVNDTGMVAGWALRSPGANERLVANVMGNCGDEFDHGEICIAGGGGDIADGHFVFDTVDLLQAMKPCGFRPALWLRI
ncbi:MAG: DUF6273 domain-containing protein [Defluviitaleaceae bacterium]|nr:DUF6273 domain-containing protein [Defluviitaleaceae bacterium]